MKERLKQIADRVVDSYGKFDTKIHHFDMTPLPSRGAVVEVIHDLFEIIYPGYFWKPNLNRENSIYYVGYKLNELSEKLHEQIFRAITHECRKTAGRCPHCGEFAESATIKLLESVPELREKLSGDVQASYDGDPAAKGYDEVIFSYPSVEAVTIYRIAHTLFGHEVPLIPRIMTEFAHGRTGIDIHPGADIGKNFFIDHGTGVVIGETTTIGDNVKIYQGVTLGALSFPKDERGKLIRGQKRHPTIEDNVVIYAHATILGGGTVIGRDSIIGGNVWITESVPARTKVIMDAPSYRISGAEARDE